MANTYEARVEFKADDDESAKRAAQKAASAINGKLTKTLVESTAFRSID